MIIVGKGEKLHSETIEKFNRYYINTLNTSGHWSKLHYCWIMNAPGPLPAGLAPPLLPPGWSSLLMLANCCWSLFLSALNVCCIMKFSCCCSITSSKSKGSLPKASWISTSWPNWSVGETLPSTSKNWKNAE